MQELYPQMYRTCKATVVNQWRKVNHDTKVTYYSPSGFVEQFNIEATLASYQVGNSQVIQKGNIESILQYLEEFGVCTWQIKFVNPNCRQHRCSRELKGNVWCSVGNDLVDVTVFAFGSPIAGIDASSRLCSNFFTPILQLFIWEHGKSPNVAFRTCDSFICKVKNCSSKEKFCLKHYVQHIFCRLNNIWINEDLLTVLYKIIVEKALDVDKKILIKVDKYIAQGSVHPTTVKSIGYK